MKHYCKKGFTLVELIVVVVILVILSTIGFISYESYLVDARDSKRLSQMNNLRDALRLFITRGPLPLPDDKVDIQSDGDVFAYQGYAGRDVLEAISFSKNTYDPLDEEFYTYYLSENKRDFQLLGYLEEDFEDSYFQELQGFVGETFSSTDYVSRFPKVFGVTLGTYIMQESQEPIQVHDKYKQLGYLDLSTDSGSLLRGVVSDSQIIDGEAIDMIGLVPQTTCLSLFRDNGFTQNSFYLINPTGDSPFLAYCDMDENGLGHGGGWTFTNFIHHNGPNEGIFAGEGGEYRYDRENLGYGYGIDLKDIYHTEGYLIVNTPDISEQTLTDYDVMNFQYNYKYPVLDYRINRNLKAGSGYRWNFNGNYNTVAIGGPIDTDNLILTRTSYDGIGLRYSGTDGVRYPSFANRQDSVFYDLSTDYNVEPSAGNGVNAWYYVR